MPKTTPEELEALQKSDPAAFDMDAEPEAAVAAVADPADEEEVADDRPRDEHGRFIAKDAEAEEEAAPAAEAGAEEPAKDDPPAQPKANGVPEARLAEVVAQRNTEREQRVAAEARAAELEAKLAEATKAPDRDYAAEKATLEQQYDDGELELKDYNRKRDELLVAEVRAGIAQDQERQRAEDAKKAVEKQQQTLAEQFTSARTRYFAVAENSDLAGSKAKVAAFEAALDEVFEARTATTYDEAFAQAGDLVRKEFGIGQAPAAKPDPHASRKAADALAASVASNTPPQARGGVGNRGTAESTLDLSKMKAGKFSSLPKDVQEKLLGEGAL